MKYSALEVSRYVLDYCLNAGSPISNLQLQKILYFLQGEYYKLTSNPLFEDEICAWKFGPVVPDVYYEFCIYGGTPIVNHYDTNIDINDKTIINGVVEQYKEIPVWKLVEKTHETRAPWDQIFNTLGDRSVIPKPVIKNFFCGEDRA